MKYLLIILLFSSCLTSKRADKRLNGIEVKYPAKIAKFARDKYPCVPAHADTITTVVELPATHDTLEVDSAILINCPDSGAKVLVKVKYFYITKTVSRDTTFTIIKTIEDSAKIKLAQLETAKLSAENTKLTKKITRLSTILWVLLALFILAVLGNYLQAKKIL